MKIYVISASRGSYSDRAEYDICWSRDEEHAKRLAAEMEAKSNEWRSRMSRCWDWERPEVEAKFKEAMADIGDTHWSHYDDTIYCAVELDEVTP